MQFIERELGIGLSEQGKILASLPVLLFVIILRAVVNGAVAKRTDDAYVIYRSRKLGNYAATIVALITLGFIWLEAFDDLTTYLGLVSAGLAIALSDLLKDIAGWLYILTRRPLRVGDRVEIDGTIGDVVDIRLVRFSLIEIGNWVDADQSTGRLIHVPNGLLFTKPIANYTEGFDYIWDEVPVLITFESDRGRGRGADPRRSAERSARDGGGRGCPHTQDVARVRPDTHAIGVPRRARQRGAPHGAAHRRGGRAPWGQTARMEGDPQCVRS